MEKFSVYPAGAQGVALLVLRVSVACALASRVLPPLSFFPGAALLALIAALLIGALVRLAAICVAFFAAIGFVAFDLANAVHFLDAAALLVLGPGAYSLDACLFGRRVIRIDGRRNPSLPPPDG